MNCVCSEGRGRFSLQFDNLIFLVSSSPSKSWLMSRTTDTQWRHESKKFENLGRRGRQNMLRPCLKIWDWDLIFGHAVKAISNQSIYNILRWLLGRWDKLIVDQESDVPNIIFFILFIDLGHSKLFMFFFVIL